jgi:hypothetical protein
MEPCERRKSKLIIHTPRATLHVPGKQVIPGTGEVALRCRCGCMKFRLFVRPDSQHDRKWAKGSAIVCTNVKCQWIIGFTPEGYLDVEGVQTTLAKEDREQ